MDETKKDPKIEEVEVPASAVMDIEDAVKYFEKLKLVPNRIDPHLPYVNLGKVYLMKGMLRKAREELTEGLKLDPENEEIVQMLASVDLSLN